MWIREAVIGVIGAIRQVVRFARFGGVLVLMSNLWLWRTGGDVVGSVVRGVYGGVMS